MRVSMDPLEGLVLHTVGYDDGDDPTRPPPGLDLRDGRPLRRPRAACTGGRTRSTSASGGSAGMANSLALGCDCLGEITYLDATFSSEHGTPYVVENAICIHEEDYGILWKHNDMNTGRTEVRRSRRLVVSSIATVGNYEYGFYWYFYLDGTIQLEVKLTGIMSTQAVRPGEETPFAIGWSRRGWPPRSTSTCSAPGSTSTSTGRSTRSTRSRFEPLPAGTDNPWGNAFRQRATRLESELQARRDVDPASGRHWRFVNPGQANGLGRPGRPTSWSPGRPHPARPAGVERRPPGRDSPATTSG